MSDSFGELPGGVVLVIFDMEELRGSRAYLGGTWGAVVEVGKGAEVIWSSEKGSTGDA